MCGQIAKWSTARFQSCLTGAYVFQVHDFVAPKQSCNWSRLC